MTVQELIQELQKYPADLRVQAEVYSPTNHSNRITEEVSVGDIVKVHHEDIQVFGGFIVLECE